MVFGLGWVGSGTRPLPLAAEKTPQPFASSGKDARTPAAEAAASGGPFRRARVRVRRREVAEGAVFCQRAEGLAAAGEGRREVRPLEASVRGLGRRSKGVRVGRVSLSV